MELLIKQCKPRIIVIIILLYRYIQCNPLFWTPFRQLDYRRCPYGRQLILCVIKKFITYIRDIDSLLHTKRAPAEVVVVPEVAMDEDKEGESEPEPMANDEEEDNDNQPKIILLVSANVLFYLFIYFCNGCRKKSIGIVQSITAL